MKTTNLLLIILLAGLLVSCSKKETEEQISEEPKTNVNYLAGTSWNAAFSTDYFVFTEDSLFNYHIISPDGTRSKRAYSYVFIEKDRIDLYECYLTYGNTFQDQRHMNAFYPYIYYIKIEGDTLYQAIDSIYVFWGTKR